MSTRRAIILRHLRALAHERHPDAAPQALRQAAEYLADEFSGLGWATTRRTFHARGRTFDNILAACVERRERQAAAPLLIGAHYDTVVGSPGADDNASGLVVLLELADALRKVQLPRPVWLAAFNLEEEGLLGSKTFADELRRAKQPFGGAIILECVGYAVNKEGSQRKPPGIPIAVPTVGNFLGIVGNEASHGLADAMARSAKHRVPALETLTMIVPGRGEQLPDTRRSDHAAFWDAGFPAVMLTDTANFRNPHYHRPTDEIETLNLDFLERVAAAVAAMAQLPVERDLS
ncbi:Peptidase M28 [Nitrospira japonica]|uniref:Peptidase M28 n=1 Tax=Nitrospira japonica TaxID=1325564 RepID=A0A1W1I3F5_9BACT|nr:M28 family peptidase [Nitrospira japonica]SLM47524.1 Peptidase M28 [Nitrospira japonica]